MKNDKFVCPICGSTHFEHIISKTHPEIFGIRGTRCIKYVGWLPKSLYNDWRNGKIDMDKVKPSKDTKVYLDILQFFKDRGFKQLSASVFSNNEYVIRLDNQTVRNKATGSKISLEQFVEELSQ